MCVFKTPKAPPPTAIKSIKDLSKKDLDAFLSDDNPIFIKGQRLGVDNKLPRQPEKT